VIICAITNQKGGVGKTTTAVNLSYTLATMGKRVLLVDLDPQGNSTMSFDLDPYTLPKTSFDFMVDSPSNIELTVHDTFHANLKLIPSTVDLAGAEIALARDVVGGTNRLRRALRLVQDPFEFIFIDTPPSLGILTINALVAATDVLIPIQAQNYALKGMRDLMATINKVSEETESSINLLGILITQFQARTNIHKAMEKEIREYFGPKVFETVITYTVRVQESDLRQVPLLRYDPDAKPAQQYLQLAQEVLARVSQKRRKARGTV